MYVYDWYFREHRWPGAVQVIKCRLCPDAKLKDFEEFKRHCKTSETHPLVIHFCDRCGDYFARDSLLPQPAPRTTTRRVPQSHPREGRGEAQGDGGGPREFVWRLQHALMTGGDDGRGFSQIIKERYPTSAKKRTGGSKQ